MKNITLALAIALGFCAIEAGAQTSTRQGRNQARVNSKRKLPDDLRAKMTPEEIREYELWLTWPEAVHPLRTDIVKKCEEEFNVVFLGEGQSEWIKGCGKCLIERGNNLTERGKLLRGARGGECWKKIDSDGVLLRAGAQMNFNEFIWMTNRANCVTIENRKKWASEHGMSYEDAVSKQKEYFDALQEREKVRLQLTRIQEELRKEREAKEKGE